MGKSSSVPARAAKITKKAAKKAPTLTIAPLAPITRSTKSLEEGDRARVSTIVQRLANRADPTPPRFERKPGRLAAQSTAAWNSTPRATPDDRASQYEASLRDPPPVFHAGRPDPL